MNQDILKASREISFLCDQAENIFPLLCYYEGWLSPDYVDYERARNADWSKDNPALSLWNHIERTLARQTDYIHAMLLTENVDIAAMLELDPDEVLFAKGTLSRMIASKYKRATKTQEFEEAMERLIKGG